MNELKIPMSGGLCTSKDPSDPEFPRGALVQAAGIYYKPGDNRVHIARTRGAFNSTPIGTGAILGCAVCEFDGAGVSRLLGYFASSPSSTDIYSATPGATGTFGASPLIAGLNPSATRMSVCHADDRWYIVNGYDHMRVVEGTADATTGLYQRTACMFPPDVAPVPTTGTSAGTTYRPNAHTSTWSDPANAYDPPLAGQYTFAYKTLSGPGGSTEIWSFAAQAFAGGGTITVVFDLVGSPTSGGSGPVGVGGFGASGFLGQLVLRLSTDGTTYPTQIAYLTSERGPSASRVTAQAVIPAGAVDLGNVKVKATFTYVNGINPGTAQVYDISATTAAGSPVTPFTPTVGMFYAYTEWDGVRGIESPASPIGALAGVNTTTGVPIANMVSVSLALPALAALKNSNTTEFRIYRTSDGGSAPQELGLIGHTPPVAGGTTFVDKFLDWAFDVQPTPLLRLQQISSGREGDLFASIDEPAPELKTITAYGGGLVGSSRSKPRELRYSEPGYPESWPPLNVIDKLSIPERDEIVHQVAVDNALLIACTGAMVVLSDLPRVLDGTFNTATAKPMQGQPGCVGQDALITYSVAGEPRAVWVSRYGIHETNGVSCRRLTNALDWDATVDTETLDTAVLHWNPKNLTIKFCYDSDGGGANDSFLLLHMAPEHQADDGPKITGPFPANIYSLCSAEVAGVYREYSGHPTNGTVYLEESTGAEPYTIQPGRTFGDGKWLRVSEANLRHSDMAGQTASLAWSMGDDANDEEQVITSTVALDGTKGTRVYVNRAGEWMSFVLSGSGSVAGSFVDIRAQVATTGKPGRIAV